MAGSRQIGNGIGPEKQGQENATAQQTAIQMPIHSPNATMNAQEACLKGLTAEELEESITATAGSSGIQVLARTSFLNGMPKMHTITCANMASGLKMREKYSLTRSTSRK
jgi:hypothetical protein